MNPGPRAKLQWIALVGGPVLALAAFVATYLTDPLGYSNQKPLAAVPAFLLSIVVLLIGHDVATYIELQRTNEHSDEIYEAVRDFLHVTKVGSPESAMEYVVARLPSLQEVRNTSFSLRDQTDRADDMFYETSVYSSLPRAIAAHTSRALKWKDIGDALAAPRLRHIRDIVTLSSTQALGKYEFRLIENIEPQINFIILSYPDGTSEVLFNWDFRSFGQDPTVLLSRDHDIIEMFTVQFEHLWRRASPDHDSRATRSTSTK